MDTDFTHAYCHICGTIKPAIREPLQTVPQFEGKFVGGDVLCGKCGYIIATVYRDVREESLPAGTIKQTPDQ
jgi:C4-type Zn-finger protein